MQPKEASCSADSCIILRYVVDAEREMTVPVGVVLSNQEEGRLWFRLPRAGEQIEGVSVATAGPYLEMARVQIEAWSVEDTLPYATASLAPLSASWWEQVRRLMPWAVRLDLPRIIDCRAAEEEIERLYEFWVRPSRRGAECVVPGGPTPKSEAPEATIAAETAAISARP